MGCWVTPNFFQSQPLAIYADIPQNSTRITLSVSQGRGDHYSYKLHSCFYPACTTFNYFRNICPAIGNFGFGVTDITNQLLPGARSLYLHGLPDAGFSSTAISGALLTVYFPVMSFNTTDKQCTFDSTETTCSVNYSVNGAGQCFYPTIPPNASISNTTGLVSFSTNETHVLWNCSTGEYSLNLHYLPISFSQAWHFIDSNLSHQRLLSFLNVSNPNNEPFADVPFMFNSGFEVETGEQNGTVNLAAMENKRLNATFSANVISYNLSFSPISFNFSHSSMLVSLSVENNFSIPFSFSSNDLSLQSLNCNEDNLDVQDQSRSNFFIFCSPYINYSFSNWTGVNSTFVSTFLTLVYPNNFTVEVYNVSSLVSEMFQKEVLAVPDSFTYTNQIPVDLATDFLTISLDNVSTIDRDELTYSISLINPAGLDFNIPLQVDFSNYLNISLTAGVLACQNSTCIENKILNTFIFNQTNFSLVAFKQFTIETTSASSSSQPISTGQGIGGAAPSSSVETNPDTNQGDDIFSQESAELVHLPQKPVIEGELTMEDLPTPIKLNEASPVSGFFAAIPSSVFLLPFGLLALFGSYAFLKKQSLVKRYAKNGKTTINISNVFSSTLKKLIVIELLPLTADISNEENMTNSAIGKVLTWKKTELKKGETWHFTYISNLPSKKGKLSYIQNGKKVEKLF